MKTPCTSEAICRKPGIHEITQYRILPERNEVVCAADISLISTGTELTCLRGQVDPGTYREEWVKYPFHSGYSMVGHVIEPGSDVTDLRQGRMSISDLNTHRYSPLAAPGVYRELLQRRSPAIGILLDWHLV